MKEKTEIRNGTLYLEGHSLFIYWDGFWYAISFGSEFWFKSNLGRPIISFSKPKEKPSNYINWEEDVIHMDDFINELKKHIKFGE